MRHPFYTNELPLAEVDEALAEVDPALFDLIPFEVCNRLRIVPLARRGDVLVVGFYEKLSALEAYEIKLLSGLRVVSVKLSQQCGLSMPSFSPARDSTRPIRPAGKSLLKRRRFSSPIG